MIAQRGARFGASWNPSRLRWCTMRGHLPRWRPVRALRSCAVNRGVPTGRQEEVRMRPRCGPGAEGAVDEGEVGDTGISDVGAGDVDGGADPTSEIGRRTRAARRQAAGA